MILVLWIISYMILKWKRENNGEEYVLRLKIYSILFTMQAFIFRKNFVEKWSQTLVSIFIGKDNKPIIFFSLTKPQVYLLTDRGFDALFDEFFVHDLR